MASRFEAEVRFYISDIGRFESKLHSLGAKIDFPYEFTDHYYRPESQEWDPALKNIRVREWKLPHDFSEVLFCHNEIKTVDGLTFKRSLLEQGKLCLYKGKAKEGMDLLEELGFVRWFDVRKERSKIWSVRDFKIAVEFISQLGWIAELEFDWGADAHLKMRKSLELMGIEDKSVDHRPIASIISSLNPP